MFAVGMSRIIVFVFKIQFLKYKIMKACDGNNALILSFLVYSFACHKSRPISYIFHAKVIQNMNQKSKTIQLWVCISIMTLFKKFMHFREIYCVSLQRTNFTCLLFILIYFRITFTAQMYRTKHLYSKTMYHFKFPESTKNW